MTRPVTHIWRLLKWGRTLARHGALRGIEGDANTPLPVKRLARLARFGTSQPQVPDYASAFQEIGPAAIKLGQTLATRPDLVGEEAAHNLLSLQDALPPIPFAEIEQAIAASFGRPASELFAEIDPEPVGSASIAQVHRGVTSDGREVAIKVLRPGIRERFARDIETYEWAAAHLEQLGAEARRLRPALTIANFRRWTNRELDLRREAASASELADGVRAIAGYEVPEIDWDRTNSRVLTVAWVDGIKISKVEELRAAGHDLPELASRLVLAFLTQAISAGFFHADMHQGNLFVKADGTIVAIDFGIMGRIDRRARQWLAEILYGLTTGNYRRVAEIHFEAQYVPGHHSVDEFATALRAVGEPMRGKPVSELSVGQMLDGLFAITRDFDMQTQPHLLLLQKTMVMVEGIATQLHPGINMWDVSAPYVKSWIRDEAGPGKRAGGPLARGWRDAAADPRAGAAPGGTLPAQGRRARTAAAARSRDHVGEEAQRRERLARLPACCHDRRGGDLGRLCRRMVGVTAPAPEWDRFATWSRGASRLVLAVVAALLLLAALTGRSELEPQLAEGEATQASEAIEPQGQASGQRDTDLQLYDRIAERVGAGENYYSVAVEEQRQRNFPVRPGLAVRLPTLAFATAWLGQGGLALAAGLLALATLFAWWRRLGTEPGGRDRRLIATLLLVIGAAIGLKGQYLVLHEVWSGMFLALAFALHRPGKWHAAWLAAALALAIREHALPFVLLLGAMALWRRDWRETGAWALLVLLFLAGLYLHLQQVGAVISEADRLSPSWLALRGMGGWTANIVLSSVLYLLPGWLAGPLAVLPLLGWAGWKSQAGLFGFLLFLGYGVFFMIAGRDNNFYWALMVTPAWFVGLAFMPQALASLWNSARGH